MAANLSKKIMVNSIVTLIGAAIMTAVLFLMVTDINGRITSIQNHRAELLSQETSATALDTLKQDISKADAYFKTLDQAIPDRTQAESEFPKVLQSLAKKYDAQLKFSLGPIAATQNDQPGYTTFEIKIISSYKNILGFLKDLETNNEPLNWQSLTVSKQNSSNSYAGLFSLRVFYK